MTITVKHSKVSTVPDVADTSLVRPSDWNADHTLTGVGTMAEQDANNVNITGGSISGATVSGYIPTSEKGAANGVATLDAGGKVPTSQIPLQGDLNYQGTWDANTNTPTLTSSTGTQGYYYVVNVAGNTNLNGITDWQIGDWAIYNGSVWQKVDNTDAVTSVNGKVGTVVLTTTDIAEGTNEYFTQARARQSVSAGTGISYDNSTGVITNSAPDQTVSLTGAGTTTVTGTYPNFTITSNDQYVGDVVGPASATDNAIARFDTTTGKLIQNSVVTIDDTGNESGILSQQFADGTAVTLAAGKQWYNATTGSWNLGMGGGNITQQVGEELYVYGKASANITDSPLKIIYKTGTVGASGVVTFAETVSGITNGDLIIGVATESITSGNFGRITSYGTVRGITTDGSAYGETWADGDEIWYNPVTGNPTKVKPSAPNIKVLIGTIINAGSGGSGSIQVEINHGSVLGGTDSNVQLSSATNGNILTYDGANSYWKNTDLTAGTAISVTKSSNGVLTVTNTAPDQTVSITGGGTTTVTGTYPNFTVSSADQYVGTVTSVSGTGSVNGLTLSGTVTSSGNLTLGGGLDLSASPTITGTLALVNGGTGASTVAGAQTNLQVDPAGTAVAMAIALG